jgi:hypothetical protein
MARAGAHVEQGVGILNFEFWILNVSALRLRTSRSAGMAGIFQPPQAVAAAATRHSFRIQNFPASLTSSA